MLDMNIAELVEKKYNQMDEEKNLKNEAYLNSPEWKELLEKARTAENKNYTVIYRDTNDELKEAWHLLNDTNIELVKKKYAEQKKEILYFIPKEKPFGAFLASIYGSSKQEVKMDE